MGSFGLSDKDTVGDYVLAKLVPMIEEKFPSFQLHRDIKLSTLYRGIFNKELGNL